MNETFTSKVASNIWKFYFFKASWMFWLVWAIDVVFYRSRGLSITQISILGVVWALTAFILEIPTGILADRWNRKYMLILSSLFTSIGFVIFVFTNNFSAFLIATAFMAARFSFASGTTNALLYDSLKTIGQEERFEKILGRSNLIGMLAVSVAGIIGSILATSDLHLPYILSALASFVASLVALSFTETKLHTSTQEIKIFDHIKSSLKLALTSQTIRFLILYLVFMDVAISLLDEYDQLYLTAISFPLLYFGFWIALRRGLGGIGGFFADRFKNKFSNANQLLVLIATIGSLLIIAFGNKYLALASFLVIFPIWGLTEVLTTGKLHLELQSHQRATVESLSTFFNTIVSAPIILLFGRISDSFGIRNGYFMTALILIIYVPIFLISARRKNLKSG